MPLQKQLLNWFHKNARSLPWRVKKNWYFTFLSEVILQQTLVDQGLPYYYKISDAFPTVHALASADEQSILKLWAGLGYYARARNLLKAAQMIVSHFNGGFPQNMKDALKLPGIGSYSAAAVLSIAFNKPYAVVDGNVLRVLARLYNIPDDIRSPAVKKQLAHLAQTLLDHKNPGLFNEAMMELGALVCTPTHPDCSGCPIASNCQALGKGTQGRLPYKSPPPTKKKQFQIITVLKHAGSFYIKQRPQNGLLGGMWEFPSISTKQSGLDRDATEKILKQNHLQASLVSPIFRQIYSHIDLKFVAALVPVNTRTTKHTMKIESEKWVNFDSFANFPIHNAHKKIIHWLASHDQQ